MIPGNKNVIAKGLYVDSRLAGNKRVEDSLKRLQTMVKNQFGKELHISPLSEVSSSAGLFMFKGEDLIIPVEVNGERLGTAIVRKATGLDNASTTRLSDLVRLILEPVLSGFAEDIKTLNNNVADETGGLEVDLSDLHPKIQNADFVEDEVVEVKVQKPITLTFESLNPNKAFQAAIDVHEGISSWAFLTWTDIRPRLRSMAELVKLGRCTIFVNDVLEISPEERDLLVRFLSIQTGEMPALVFGTRRPLQVLASEGLLDDGLVNLIQKFTLKLDLIPNSKGALKECIDLLVNGELQLDSE